MGTPYIYGGTSSSGVDCSGLVQLAAKASGIDIPRTTYDQINVGQAVSKNNLQEGDLVFFRGSGGSASTPGHVGIYIGNGQYIQAPKTGDVQADENIKDSQSTNNNTESDEENVSENNKTVLNSQSENDTIKEKPDFEIGDVIEYDGRQWEVTQTGLNMSFKNLDKSDSKQTFSYIGGMENFKQTHDYKMISKADNQENGGKENGISQQGVLDGKGRNDDRGLHARTKAELTEFIRHIATIATKDCKNQLETKETDPMSEMIAREYTEELIKEKLHQKLKEYHTLFLTNF